MPIDWNSPINILTLGPHMLTEMEEIVKKIHQNLKAAQDIKKAYVDKRRTYK